jgi:hypothetical protein
VVLDDLNRIPGQAPAKAARHVQTAINEPNIALSIK